MRLLNRTKAPDEALAGILRAAAREAGAKTTRLVVQVNPSRYCQRGTAYNAAWVRWPGRSRKNIRRVSCSAAVRLSLIYPIRGDALLLAESFYRLCVHEMVHVHDYQRGGMTFSHAGPSGRRPPHDSRPEERRARGAAKNASLVGAADAVLALALWLDSRAAV